MKTESGNCVDEYGYDWMGNVIKTAKKIKKISTGVEKTYKTFSRSTGTEDC